MSLPRQEAQLQAQCGKGCLSGAGKIDTWLAFPFHGQMYLISSGPAQEAGKKVGAAVCGFEILVVPVSSPEEGSGQF